MGTRSLIFFEQIVDGKTVTYVVVYQSLDGFPCGVGLILAYFLKQKHIVNGISRHHSEGIANGFGCLVAQFIAREKKQVGDVYILSQEDLWDWIEWEYRVVYNREEITINIKNINEEKTSDGMSIDQFLQYCCNDGNHDIKNIDIIMSQREEADIVRRKVRKELEKSMYDDEYTTEMLNKNIDKIMNDHPNSKKRCNYKSDED